MTSVKAVPFANARLRIKRDVLFTETPDGVLFHNAHGGFHLGGRTAYRFAAAIVPYLNGEYQVRDLVKMLPTPQQQEMVVSLVRILLERGLARDIPPSDQEHLENLDPAVAVAFGPQINYIDHYEDRPAQRFDTFRTGRVVIIGDDAVAGWCATSLIRNGIASIAVAGPVGVFAQAVDEARALTDGGTAASVVSLPESTGLRSAPDLADYDLIVTAGAQAPAQITALLTAGLRPHQRLLPFTMYGHRAILGPLTVGGTRGCWFCAMLRLSFNGDSGAAADVFRQAIVGGDNTSVRPGRHLSAMLGNLLAFEIFRDFTQVLPAETEGGIIVQEIDSFDTAINKVHPHPLCTLCGEDTDAVLPLDLTRTPLVPPVDNGVPRGDEIDPAIAELDALTASLVGTAGGVFREFDDDWPTQLPLKVSRLRFGTGVGRRRVITAFDIHHVAGARMRGIRVAAAAYIAAVTPPPAQPAPHAGPRIAPPRFTTYSATAATAKASGWVEATAMVDSTKALVPVEAVRPQLAVNSAKLFSTTPAGVGVGTTAAAAAYRGLMSAVTYATLMKAVHSGDAYAIVDVDTLEGEELTFLARCTRTLDIDVDLIALRSDEVTVLLARATGSGGQRLWAHGSDLCAKRAAQIALRDLLGQVQIMAQSDEPVDLGERLLESFDPYTVAVDGTASLTTSESLTARDLMVALRADGLDPYLIADGSPDLRRSGLHVQRVLLAVTDRA